MGDLFYQIQAGVSEAKKDSGPAKAFEDRGTFAITDDFHINDTYVYSLDWRTPVQGLKITGSARISSLDMHGVLTDYREPVALGYANSKIDDYNNSHDINMDHVTTYQEAVAAKVSYSF